MEAAALLTPLKTCPEKGEAQTLTTTPSSTSIKNNNGIVTNGSEESSSVEDEITAAAKFASRTAKRAIERVLANSLVFSQKKKVDGKNANGGGVIVNKNGNGNTSNGNGSNGHTNGHSKLSHHNQQQQQDPSFMEVDHDRILVGKLLGKGGFCQVHSVIIRDPPPTPSSSTTTTTTSTTNRSTTRTVTPNTMKQFNPLSTSSRSATTASTFPENDESGTTNVTDHSMTFSPKQQHQQQQQQQSFLLQSSSQQQNQSNNLEIITPIVATTSSKSFSPKTSQSSCNPPCSSSSSSSSPPTKKSTTNNQNQNQNAYCIKFLKPSIVQDRKRFARGTADLSIEANFLAMVQHPNIIRLCGYTTGFELFVPHFPDFSLQMKEYMGLNGMNNGGGSDGGGIGGVPHISPTNGRTLSSMNSTSTSPSNSNNNTNHAIPGYFFLILERLHTTLNHVIQKDWKPNTDQYSSLFYRCTNDFRGLKRKASRIERLNVALDLARALAFLHASNIVYRDLKPDNIGFDMSGKLKLFDFGLAKELKSCKKYIDGTYLLTANTGSRRYMAPEVACHERYNLSVDVFSYGILLWELCCLLKPFDGFTEIQHMNLVVKRGYRPPMEEVRFGWGDNVKELMRECWDASAFRRPGFDEVVERLEGILESMNV